MKGMEYMNLDNIKALADVLNAKGLSAIEIGSGESRIRIEKEPNKTLPAANPADKTNHIPGAVVQTTDETNETVSNTMSADDSAAGQPIDYAQLIEIKSPLVGVYYAAPSPDAETFVSIGSKIKKGDVLCIIETMKLMNEITAEQDGEIADICIKNGDIAEYGQVLFKVR